MACVYVRLKMTKQLVSAMKNWILRFDAPAPRTQQFASQKYKIRIFYIASHLCTDGRTVRVEKKYTFVEMKMERGWAINIVRLLRTCRCGLRRYVRKDKLCYVCGHTRTSLTLIGKPKCENLTRVLRIFFFFHVRRLFVVVNESYALVVVNNALPYFSNFTKCIE